MFLGSIKQAPRWQRERERERERAKQEQENEKEKETGEAASKQKEWGGREHLYGELTRASSLQGSHLS